MAKVLVAVLATLLLINTMTFLIVVNQEEETESVRVQESDPNSALNAAIRRQAVQLKSMTQSITDLKRSVQSMTSRLSQLHSKVTAALRRPPPAPAPSSQPTETEGGQEDEFVEEDEAIESETDGSLEEEEP